MVTHNTQKPQKHNKYYVKSKYLHECENLVKLYDIVGTYIYI